MAKREGLYLGLLEFIRAAVSHDTICQIIAEPLTLYPAEEQLFLYSCKGSQPGVSLVAHDKGKAKSFEQTDSIATIFHRAAALWRGILEQAVRHQSDFQGPDGQRILVLCRQYTSLALLVGGGAAGRATAGASTTVPGAPAPVVPAKQGPTQELWHRENCLLELPESEMLKGFFFAGQAQHSHGPIKGRMKKLITDLNVMRLSLPQGIFVRHDSSRLDVMKVLIVGPASTPYEGGLFEFDLFCPMTFPQSPPLMRLKTTGGGRVRFNPNLYADGLGK